MCVEDARHRMWSRQRVGFAVVGSSRKKAGPGRIRSLGPNLQTGGASRVGDVLEGDAQSDARTLSRRDVCALIQRNGGRRLRRSEGVILIPVRPPCYRIIPMIEANDGAPMILMLY
jgi:hypothetical protein